MTRERPLIGLRPRDLRRRVRAAPARRGDPVHGAGSSAPLLTSSYAEAHCDYLQVFSDAGSAGGIARPRGRRRACSRPSVATAWRRRTPEAIVLAAVLAAGAAAALTWFPLQRPITAVPLLLAAGRAWKICGASRPRSRRIGVKAAAPDRRRRGPGRARRVRVRPNSRATRAERRVGFATAAFRSAPRPRPSDPDDARNILARRASSALGGAGPARRSAAVDARRLVLPRDGPARAGARVLPRGVRDRRARRDRPQPRPRLRAARAARTTRSGPAARGLDQPRDPGLAAGRPREPAAGARSPPVAGSSPQGRLTAPPPLPEPERR